MSTNPPDACRNCNRARAAQVQRHNVRFSLLRQVLLWFDSCLTTISTMLGSRVTCLLIAAVLLAPSTSHGQQLTQYAHTAWRFQEGVFDASPVSIAQTTDGFLWIGTLNGLIRFDGVHFESWNDRLQKDLNTCCALSLLGSSDGSLWIGTAVGLAKLNDGQISAVTKGDARYNRLVEDGNGRIWAARSRIRDNKGPLCEVEGTQVQCHGDNDGLGCQNGNSLAQDNSGTIWFGELGKICSWNNGAAAIYTAPPADPACKPAIGSLLVDVDRSILLGCEGGLRRLEQGRFVPFRSASLDADKLKGSKLLYDRGGSLWIGTTNDGLYHLSNGVADHFGVGDGLSDDNVSELFEDREGNIWVVTPEGVDRFNRVSVVSFSSRQGLSGIGGSAVLASRDGHTIWTSGLQGLASIRDGKITLITQKEGLPGQQVTALFEDHQGVLWMGIDKDLFSYSNGRFSKKVRNDGESTGMVVGLAEDASQSIWIITTGTDRLLRLDPKTAAIEAVPELKDPTRLASSSKGLVYLFSYPLGEISIPHDDQPWEKVLMPTGPRTGRSLLAYGEDSLFVTTDTGLYRWKDKTWSSLTAKNGLPCEVVQDVVNEEDGGLWLRLACGFVHISKGDLDTWSGDTTIRLDLKLHDALDGARPGRGSFEPAHARAADGQLWFANGSVLQMIDPRNLMHNELPPPVHILGMVADHKTISSLSNVRLPALTRDLRIDYAALSLVSPEKVRFRYALWGVDKDWQEAGSRREAYYMNLRPGRYQFQVIASNNDGVWNQQGAMLDFYIAPAYYQTNWFRALCVIVFLLLLWAAYQFRVRQLAHQFNRTFEARVSERTRIARELHDTLLQSFQGLLLRFQSVAKLLPARPDEARQRLDNAIQQAAEAITEGRDAVQGLRSSAFETNDLANAIAAMAEELTKDTGAGESPVVDLEVEGAPRGLNPVVRDEAYRIACEALRNAFRHAQARRIIMEIRYDKRQFRLRVRDDGKGIDEDPMQRQPSGHFGLPGMRERAETVGGRLEIWSKLNSGTQVELSIPGTIAYDGAHRSVT
jgi:signal transduction histidine kinase/ligand-binding sensor domain-containing protein